MTSYNAYRGFKSTTFTLILMGFWTGTGLLIADLITASIWETSVLGLITIYIVRAGMGSAAEAYMAAKSAAPPVATTTIATTASPESPGGIDGIRPAN